MDMLNSFIPDIIKDLKTKASNMREKFAIGEQVKTIKTGLVCIVIGSAKYPGLGYIEYRLRAPMRKRTFYRKEKELEKDTEQTLTIFRKDPDGEVFALFPEDEGAPGYSMSYQHIGQHSSADYRLCIRRSKPASPEEYADLKEELESIGYNLKIRKRWMRKRRID